MQDLKPEPLYTLREASALYRLKYWQLQRLCKDNQIDSVSLFGRRRFVRLSDVERFFDRLRKGGVKND